MDNDYLLQQKIEVLFDIGFKKVINEIKSVKDDIGSLRNDLNRMQHEMNALQSNAFQSQPTMAVPLRELHREGPAQRMQSQQQSQMQRVPIQAQQQQMYQQPAQMQKSMGQQRLAPQRQQAQEQKSRLDQPIDRNNVSPASVSIEKIFYAGKK